VDFVVYEADPPSYGVCGNGTMTITGVDGVTSKILPANLCGSLTGQHLYLSVVNSTSINIAITLIVLTTQTWQLKIRQFESVQADYLAPRGCLQYYK
jgi:hypothetical protein